jgi:predicted permease
MISKLIARVRSLGRGIRERSAVETEMGEEFRLHIELRAQDLLRAGLSPEAALLRARREFGSTERYKEEARASRGLRSIDELRFSWLDFKLGLRMLVRYPGLTIVGGLAMAVAIAMGAAAFEAIKQVVFPTLPFSEGERIVSIQNWDAAAGGMRPSRLSDFGAWRAQVRSVQDLGAWRTVARNLITEQGESAPIEVAELSASAFRITGVAPILGRVLVDADEQVGALPVIVIGYDVWQTRFRGDPAVVGRGVRLGSMTATVAGVMPKGFLFPENNRVWTPLRFDAAVQMPDGGPVVDVFGRLAPAADLAEARAELTSLGRRAAIDFPATHQRLQPQVMHFADAHTPIHCTTGWIHCLSLVRTAVFSSNLIFVVLVALICANVALLMFARAAAREGEIIVRNALGASRGRIITQLVAEALVLGAMAAIVGLLIAGFALKAVVRLLEYEGSLPFWWRPALSLPSVWYAVGLTVLGATIAGVLPALKVTRGLSVPLRLSAPGGSRLHFGGLWTLVIVAQIALTVVAVANTAYISQFAARIAHFELGFPGHEYLSVRLVMDDEIPAQLHQELERRLRAEPAVIGVSFASQLPGGDRPVEYLEVEGVANTPPWVQSAAIDEDFFNTMHGSLVAGRGFRTGDFDADQRVLVVNADFVQRVLGGRQAVGRRVRFRNRESGSEPWGPWHEIIGVVQGIPMNRHPEMSPAGLYLPLKPEVASVRMAVHLRNEPESFTPRLRAIATALEPNLRLYEPMRLDRIGNADVSLFWLGTRILIGGSLLILALSLAGIYAIMSFTVSRRTREIGIRVALGADRRRILASSFARPLAQIAAGVFLGVAFCVLYLRGEVQQSVAGGIGYLRVAAIIVGFTAAMFAVCMLACIVPTRRALGIQPTAALKQE